MPTITFPLPLQINHAAVADLQTALQAIGHVIAYAEKSASLFGPSTREAVLAFQVAQGLAATGEVDQQTAARLEAALAAIGGPASEGARLVRGRVSDADGKPAAGYRVRAFDRNVGEDDRLLGESTTDGEGNYAIAYAVDRLEGKPAADLLVALYPAAPAPPAPDAPLQSTDTLFDARPEKVQDFTLPLPATPEIERLAARIRPLLRGGIRLAVLDRQQTAFLGRKTGCSPAQIERLTESHRLAGADQSLAAFYYALVAADLPTAPEAILSRDPAAIGQAIDSAAARGLIAPLDPAQRERILNDELPRLRALNLLRPAVAGQPASLGDLLDTLPETERLDDDERLVFATRYGQHGDTASLWQAAQTDPYAAKLPAVKRTLALNALTQGHTALIADLQARHDPAATESIRYLARLSRRDWLQLALLHGAPPASSLSDVGYGFALDREVERRFPMPALRERLESREICINGFPTAEVVKVLTEHPDFDPQMERADAYLERIGAKTPELSAALRKVQRVLPLAGRLRASAALMNAGLDSAYAIDRAGAGAVVACLSGEMTVDAARGVHAAARDVTATALALVTRYSPLFNRHAIPAIPFSRANAAFLEQYPNLRLLFGDLDYCACTHCQSVLGPAAYLADVLHFLETPPAEAGVDAIYPLSNSIHTSRAFFGLFFRRPDLANLLLTCENTNTELPYIDLVLEVLENTVALPMLVPVTTDQSGPILEQVANGQLPDEIRQALAATAITISEDLTVTQIHPPWEWLQIFLAGPFRNGPSYKLFDPSSAFFRIDDGARRWLAGYIPNE